MNLVAYRIHIDPSAIVERSRFGTLALALTQKATSYASEAVEVADGLSTTVKTVVYAPFGKAVTSFLSRKQDAAVELLSSSELEKYTSYDSEGALINGVYVAHPAWANKLVPAENFHRILEREQISEIIRFARSELKISSIRIAHHRDQVTKTKSGAAIEGIPTEISASVGNSQSTLAYFTYDTPRLIQLDEPLVWKSTYQELFYGLKGSSGGGTAQYSLHQAGIYSVSGEAAKLFKMQASYLNNRILEVEILYI